MPTQKKSELRKDRILKAAERIFAEKGFQDSTISHVAQEARVSDATIYEYFSSKEELLFSIPGETARRATEDLRHILKHVRDASNKVRSIIYSYIWFYENNPDYASVAMLILKQNRKFLETESYEEVRELSRLIITAVKEGIDSGEFRPDIDPNLVRSVILGTIEHILIRKILLGKPENILKVVDPLTDLILDGIKCHEEPTGWNLSVNLVPEDKARERNSGHKKTGNS